jgi:hypothetical protein
MLVGDNENNALIIYCKYKMKGSKEKRIGIQIIL